MSNNNKAYAEGFLTNLVPQFTPLFTIWLSNESYMDRGVILGRRPGVRTYDGSSEVRTAVMQR